MFLSASDTHKFGTHAGLLDYQNAIFHYTLAIETTQSEVATFHKDDSLKQQLASLYSNRAAASTMLSHYTEAMSDCQAAIDCYPLYEKPYLRKAQLQIMNGLLEDAMTTCNDALSTINPPPVRAIQESREIMSLQLKYAHAIDFFQRLHTNDDKEISNEDIAQVAKDVDCIVEKCCAWQDAKVLQAEALWAMGHSEQAFELCTKLAKQQPPVEQNPRLCNLLAVIYVSMGKSEDAIRNLRTVLAHDKDNARATKLYSSLKQFLESKAIADMQYKSRQYDDALEQYGVAMKLCPSPAYMSKLYFNRACTNASLGRHDLSISDCTESIRLNDGYIKAYMRRAASLRLMMTNKEEQTTLAIRNYEVALTLCKTKHQSRNIIKKLKETKLELNELQQVELDLRRKLQRRLSEPVAVSTPDCSPQWVRKSDSQLSNHRKGSDSMLTAETASMSITRTRSRTSSTSSFKSTRSNSSAPFYVSPE